MINRPAPDEYNPYYAGYINRVPEGDIFEILTRQIDELNQVLSGLSDEQALFRHAPHEWSIKEVIGHLNDGERVFGYRAMCISRGETAPLHGFDQDAYVRESNYDSRPLAELIQEFEYLRRANLLTLKSVSDEASMRRGTASNFEITPRALIYILAGHVYHHLESLQKEYLSQGSSSK